MPDIDARRQNQSPVAAKEKEIVLLHSTNATTITQEVGVNGTLMHLFLDVPDLDGATCKLYVTTAEGRVFYTSDDLAKNKSGADSHHLLPGCCVVDTDLIKIVTADNQTADRTFTREQRYV